MKTSEERYDRKRSAFLCLLIPLLELLLIPGCDSQRVSPSVDPTFFEPREMGTYTPAFQDVVEDEKQPFTPRIEPPDNYPWAPQDRPIWFHSLEESMATRDQWRPYLHHYTPDQGSIGQSWGLNRRELSFSWLVSSRLAEDRQLTEIYEAWPEDQAEAPTKKWIGLGGPFVDEYFHVFECGDVRKIPEIAAMDRYENFPYLNIGIGYFMGDYVVRCRGKLWSRRSS
ncbi:MAG: hypothetical protein ACNA8W_06165 [Bradymonadaceae bacterium]